MEQYRNQEVLQLAKESYNKAEIEPKPAKQPKKSKEPSTEIDI